MMTTVVTQPNFTDFTNTSGLRFTGYGDSATTLKKSLQLTDGGNTEARAAFWTQQVPVDTFSTTFNFASTNAKVSADGFAFVIQNYGTGFHGRSGANLGYSGAQTTKSIAAAFNLYNTAGYQSKFGYAQGNEQPVTETLMDPVDMHIGHVLTANITYDGTTLTTRVTDTTDSSLVFRSAEVVNIPSIVGGNTAFIGFTAATGVQVSTQVLTNWSYSGNNTPSITKHATASPASAKLKTGTTLKVTASGSGGASALSYTWSLVTQPSSKAKVKYSANGTNAARATNVTFKVRGRYVFLCTVKDKYGFTVASNSVIVKVA